VQHHHAVGFVRTFHPRRESHGQVPRAAKGDRKISKSGLPPALQDDLIEREVFSTTTSPEGEDVDASVRFYENALKAFGYVLCFPRDSGAGSVPEASLLLALLPGKGPGRSGHARGIRAAGSGCRRPLYEGGLAGGGRDNAAPACASTTARRTTRRSPSTRTATTSKRLYAMSRMTSLKR